MYWPLVGRAEHLSRLVAAFGARSGALVVVSGPAGVGKSRLLAEARERALAQRVPSRMVLATAATAALPFGPFAPLLPPGGGRDLSTALASALDRLREGAPGRPALAVDDAHLLDSGSAALLQLLAASGEVATRSAAARGSGDAYAKLGVDGRAELAAVLGDSGWAGTSSPCVVQYRERRSCAHGEEQLWRSG